ncbi:DNA topoisomerase 3-beta-1, putative [Entamoeba dispar SAW760]|uniref:DNA topoisomerase n=1 Tax=Entamoeba dispar (strain ATCC PRA-260 / SAW760) TaxID=370354 RepID=B0ERJ9_ENTDS|nr:DNA topoisomerase 3-beta-1, putative [Entamoeba dispar SAW760]EDR22857.1 DNA topoisomerase 3-beta-1, putative [Entamoeba dispar SAW760]|eukprot:EDR22857.1 DNA topoisomerase 3-beta-1, putative [Entamoeba dispar SAW760]
MTLLMVAEKPLLAESIANFLSLGPVKTRKGIAPSCPVHEFNCKFKGKITKAKMTSVAGHVYTCEFERAFQNWSVDPRDLFNCKVIKVEANPKTHIPSHLRNEAKGCNGLVLWLDCDREGENICFEVMENTVDYMTKTCKIYRALFSSITKKDITEAFNHLGQPDERLAEAVDCRQEIDLRVGVAFTRLQTKFLKERFPKLGDSLISFGPCQTPTLGFCVDRQKEIDNFVSKPFYTLKVILEDHEGRNKTLKLDKCFDNKSDVDDIVKSCKGVQGKVIKMNVNELKKSRPIGLNTVEMLKAASIKLGLGPQDTMRIAEKLYTRGYISYPRTESTKYSSYFNFDDILNNLQETNQFREKVQLVKQNGINIPRNGEDKGDHPPITPLNYPNEYLNDSEKKLFDFITNTFLASIYKDSIFQKVNVSIQIGNYTFNGSGKVLKDPGFKKIISRYDEDEEIKDSDLIKPTSFIEGDIVIPSMFDIVKGMTTCPDYLTEYELISLMEKNGIGTDASIPVHIQNIITREYVSLDTSKRTLRPTKIGLALAKTLETVDKNLITPQIRAHIESMVSRIAEGKAQYENVLEEALDTFEQNYLIYKQNLKVLEENFAPLYQVQEQSRLFSKCGKCGRILLKVIGDQTYLSCPNCSLKFNLPQNVSYSQQTKCCPICKFETIMTSSLKSTKKEMVCPGCYNEKNQFMKQEHSSCLQCSNPECKLSYERTKTCLCSVCGGVMCLSSLQNKWSCFCNTCDSHMEWIDTIKKALPNDEICGKCKTYHLVDLTMKDNTVIKGCMNCDSTIKKLYTIKAVFYSTPTRKGRHYNTSKSRGGYTSHDKNKFYKHTSRTGK